MFPLEFPVLVNVSCICICISPLHVSMYLVFVFIYLFQGGSNGCRFTPISSEVSSTTKMFPSSPQVCCTQDVFPSQTQKSTIRPFHLLYKLVSLQDSIGV